MRLATLVTAVPVLCCAAAAAVQAVAQQPFSMGASATQARYGMASTGKLSPDTPFDDVVRIEVPTSSASDAHASMAGLERSIADVIAAQKGKHVVLSHPEFPQLSVRIRQMGTKTKTVSEMREAPNASPLQVSAKYNNSDPTAFCDPTVTSWSGYVDTIDGKSLFFYFFESRDNPDKDPVLMWLNGGPGCSSSMGLFMELGPCSIPENNAKIRDGPPINGTKWNEYSWNSHANIFFVDQPVDVGYSYTRYGVHVYDADSGAKDMYAFLRIFFGAFKKFHKSDFIITGESYGGRYLPRYASEIIDRNYAIEYRALREDKPVDKSQLINLKKVAIGNGLTDGAEQIPEYYDFMCTSRGGVAPFLSIETCKRLVTWKSRCKRWLYKECRETYDPDLCSAATDKCDGEMTDAFFNTGRNPYNVKDLCKTGYSPNLCYAITADIRAYLDRDDVRKLVGAEPVSSIGKFASCNMKVAAGFQKLHDATVNNADYIAGLLERNVEILLYVGKLDWICNWLGNEKWVNQLGWTHSESFHSDELHPWHVDGKEAGMTRHGGGLTWATVNDAGHMVPYDQPKVALEMLTRFLTGDKL